MSPQAYCSHSVASLNRSCADVSGAAWQLPFATSPGLPHIVHDGGVATLEDAIDLELYCRGLQVGRPLDLTVEDRRDLKAFLEKP